MSEEDDEGDTNAQYYSHLWTKPIKVRSSPKRVKHKRHSKKVIHIGNVSVSIIKHLRGLHNERIHTTHSPLFRR